MCKLYEEGLFEFKDKNNVLCKPYSFKVKLLTQIDMADWATECDDQKTTDNITTTSLRDMVNNWLEADTGVTDDDLTIMKAVCAEVRKRKNAGACIK